MRSRGIEGMSRRDGGEIEWKRGEGRGWKRGEEGGGEKGKVNREGDMVS